MTWNYRLVYRKDCKTAPGAGEGVYAVHEVHYADDGAPVMVTESAVGVVGETPEEAAEAYRMMGEAFRAPVLEYDDFLHGGRFCRPLERRV